NGYVYNVSITQAYKIKNNVLTKNSLSIFLFIKPIAFSCSNGFFSMQIILKIIIHKKTTPKGGK
ncbi:hypothetical protein BU025_13025, partial [Staphylococcus simulans]